MKMKVLINLPNGTTTYCVECDPKAIGQECLEKVCQELNIHCETEYFGLLSHNRRSSTSSSAFSSSPASPVPCSPLLAGCSSSGITVPPALVPNSLTLPSLESPTTIPASALIPSPPAILPEPESRTRQWINLRNPLGRTDGNYFMLALRVKFWVPVHLILQESVRNLFYMEARQNLIENRMFAKDWSNAIKLAALMAQADGIKFNPECLQDENTPLFPTTSSKVNNQSDFEQEDRKERRRRGSKRKSSESSEPILSIPSNNPLNVYEPYGNLRPNPNDINALISKEHLLMMIAKEHEKYASLRVKSARYWLLAEFSKLEGFGEEVFSVPKSENLQTQLDVAVGPHGIMMYAQGQEKKLIPFSAIQTAKSNRRSFRLTHLNENYKSVELELKMQCQRTATSLYRAVTEMHAFYSCETVRSAVTKQFIRDLKGTFFSIFNEDTELGKRYVFDIQKTCREVHDFARRVLHSRGIPIAKSFDETEEGATSTEEIEKLPANLQDIRAAKEAETEAKKKMEKEVMSRIVEAITCRICMDSEINSMFAPCGHVLSCVSCAIKCDRCPMCRSEIENVNKIYLPTELRTVVAA